MYLTLHKPLLVSHRPCVQTLPEVRHHGLVNMSPVLVNLFIHNGQSTRIQELNRTSGAPSAL